MLHPLVVLFRNYFLLRQLIPFYLYILHSSFRDEEHPVLDKAVKPAILLVVLAMGYFLVNFISGRPITDAIPFRWSYPGPITWGIFFLVYYRISVSLARNKITAFTLSTLATVGGGWLYEVPFFHPLKMFISGLIFVVNPQILCLLVLGYELRRMGFKMNALVIMMLILFLSFSLVLFIDPRIFYGLINETLGHGAAVWFLRIPACLFLISLLGGIKNGGS